MTQPQMFSLEAEMSVLGGMLIDTSAIAKVVEVIQGESPEKMFFEEKHRVLFRAMIACWSKHGVIEPVLVMEELKDTGDTSVDAPYLAQLWDYVPTSANIEYHARVVRDKYALREVVRIGEGMVKAAQAGKHVARDIVDRALNRLTSVVLDVNPSTLRTRADFVAAELLQMDQPEAVGAPMPYSKLQGYTGDLIPGDTVLMPGYSNSGKTLVYGNFARHWAIKGIPAIHFPTESQRRFLSRVAAAHARVPQVLPERNRWHEATEDQREAYEFALKDLEKCPWQIVPQRFISVDEIIAQATMRRREYDGMPVVVAVDHMHRLNYQGKQPAFEVAPAVQRLRDWAGEDRYGGIILLLLAQPKKPEIDVQIYKPVHGYGISGGGGSMSEADLILSPYRRWVKTEEDWEENPYHRTAWGTPKAKLKDGHPVPAKPESEDAKVDDEHVAVKIGKRRTGGEGPTVLLSIDAPSGYIYQIGAHDGDQRQTGTH